LLRFLQKQLNDALLMANWAFISQKQDVLKFNSLDKKESILQFYGNLLKIHCHGSSTIFCDTFKLLITHSATSNNLESALAIYQLFSIPKESINKSLPEISVWAVDQFETNKKILQNIAQIMQLSISDFIERTYKYTLQHLLLNRKLFLIHQLINRGRENEAVKVGVKLIEYSGDIVSFLLVNQGESGLDYYMDVLNKLGLDGINLKSVLKTNQLQLVHNLVLEMSSNNPEIAEKV
jgi:hypothetical protein